MSDKNREPCPECRKMGRDSTGDNLCRFPDGGAHCFACGYHVHASGQVAEEAVIAETLTKPLKGRCVPLDHRRIDERTCRLFDYRLAKIKGQIAEVENFYLGGKIVAQHVRMPGKNFFWKGDTSQLPLWGQWLWSGGGKRIVVTEGAIDAMTISMLQKNRWPVVSIPNGVSHAPKAIKTNLQFLQGYDEIILCFDNDAPGRDAAETCAALLPPGRVRIAKTPRKDANAHLMANDTQPLITALFEARQYQPDGILHVSDVNEDSRVAQKVWLFPWDCLTENLLGQRSGEMTLWASGTGSGKSTVIREMAFDHLINGRRVGLLMLEEAPHETLDDLIALMLSKPVRQIKASRALNGLLHTQGRQSRDFGVTDDLTDEEYEAARKQLRSLPLYIYDHRGSNAFDNILSRIEYMATALGCDVIILDHITAVIAGMEKNASEREGIDILMKSLRSIVERTGVHLDVVSQLNRLEGKAAEEGGQISLKNLRGSGSLGSVPNSVLAVERNQQDEDPSIRAVMKVRVLKGRFAGTTGIAGYLKYDYDTRRLCEHSFAEGESSGSTFTKETTNEQLEQEELDPEGVLDVSTGRGEEQPEPAFAASALDSLLAG